MSATRKALIVIAVCATIVVVGWAVIIGAVYATGVVTFKLEEDGGPSIFVPVPAAMVDAAGFVGGKAFDGHSHLMGELEEELRAELGIDLGEWQPMVREMLEVIEDCPDVTFVEVEDGEDHVKIVKEGRYLRVIVSDPGFNLDISLPTKTATRTVERLIG